MNKHQKIEAGQISFNDFVLHSKADTFPKPLYYWAKRQLGDLISIAVAGRKTKLSNIIHHHVAEHYQTSSTPSSLWFDGRKVSALGASLANGMTIDAIDAHDGSKPTKGHVGCGLLPSLIVFAERENLTDGSEFLTRFIIGYEIGTRCGIALHGTADDYHTSGAWIALASAALGARALSLDQEQLRHAIGIAEYHGPRSQMMRVIDHPTMLKDGSGIGAMVGVQSTLLAKDGFTGAPAITIEGEDCQKFWSDLGERWYIKEQYVKLWPVCRWAQPACQALIDLKAEHAFSHDQIEEIEVTSFHEAVRLSTFAPQDTEQAQYSLPWPVASIAVNGKVGVDEISEKGLKNQEILQLSSKIILKEADEYNAAFPARRIAHVSIELKDGTRFTSQPTEAAGDPEAPLSDKQMLQKFHTFCDPVLGETRSKKIRKCIQKLEEKSQLSALIKELATPI